MENHISTRENIQSLNLGKNRMIQDIRNIFFRVNSGGVFDGSTHVDSKNLILSESQKWSSATSGIVVELGDDMDSEPFSYADVPTPRTNDVFVVINTDINQERCPGTKGGCGGSGIITLNSYAQGPLLTNLGTS